MIWCLCLLVRQVYSSSFLNNIPWLDGSGGPNLNSPYTPSPSTWTGSPFGKAPMHPHTSSSLYPPTATSSFASPREGIPSPGLDGKESLRLQDAMKGERLSPLEGAGGSFLTLSSAAGGVYPPHSHSLGHYNSYMASSQDYNAAALYPTPAGWPTPSPYSPKLRNKMRLSPPGVESFLPSEYAYSDIQRWKLQGSEPDQMGEMGQIHNCFRFQYFSVLD